MTMYAIVISSVRLTKDGYSSSRQTPTFYLDSKVQGIVNAKHAALIALDIANTFHATENNERISVYAINNDDGTDNYHMGWKDETK